MNTQEYNHPAYINTPFFVLQDKKLNFFNKFLFSLFWSFSLSGKKIKASNGYLASLFHVDITCIGKHIKELEDLGYIKRVSEKYQRFIEVIYNPTLKIEIDSDCADIELSTPSSVPSTNLEQGTPPGGGGVRHLAEGGTLPGVPYNKDNNKEDIKDKTTPAVAVNGKVFFLTLEDLLKDNPHNIDEQMLNEWLVTRKKKKAPVTQTAWSRTNKVMRKLVDAGFQAIDCFERMVASGWQGMEFRYFEQDINCKSGIKILSIDEKKQSEIKAREEERIRTEQTRKDAVAYREIQKNMVARGEVPLGLKNLKQSLGIV
jgi:hypothetical protein